MNGRPPCIGLRSDVATPRSSRTTIVSFPDGTEAIANGSFEDGTGPGGTFAPDANGIMLLANGSTAMPAWLVIDNDRFRQNIAWISNSNRFVPNATTDGTHFVDLTGNDNQDPNHHFGVLRQVFPTVDGALYQLSFAMAVSNPNNGGPIRVTAGIASAADEREYFQMDCGPWNSTLPGTQWKTCAGRFIAASNSTVLKLYGQLGTHFIGLDSVSAQCVAPLGLHAFCGQIGRPR